MLRNIKSLMVACFVLQLSFFAYAQGGAATGDLHVSVKDPKGSGDRKSVV